MIKTVNLSDIKEAIKSKSLSLIDVREADEYATGHIPSAVNLPLSELSERFSELDASIPHHLICQSGMRSGRAASYLSTLGYDVTNIIDGTLAWQDTLER